MSVTSRISYYVAVTLLCGGAFAQPPTAPPTSPPFNPDSRTVPGTSPSTSSYPGAAPDGTDSRSMMFSDESFVKKAAEDHVTELELAKLAQVKGSNEAVMDFSKRIVDDHARTKPDLETAAAKVKVEVPTEVTRGGKKSLDKLAKLSGPDFDRAYAKLMLNEQKDRVQYFTQAAQSGTVPEVKAFAVKTLPTVQQHQKMAEELETTVKK